MVPGIAAWFFRALGFKASGLGFRVSVAFFVVVQLLVRPAAINNFSI